MTGEQYKKTYGLTRVSMMGEQYKELVDLLGLV